MGSDYFQSPTYGALPQQGKGVITVSLDGTGDYGPAPQTTVDATNAVNTFGIYEAIRDVISGKVSASTIYVSKGAYNFGTVCNGCYIPILNAVGLRIIFDPEAVLTFNAGAGGGVIIRYANCNGLEITGGQWVYAGANATVGAISGVGGNQNIYIHDPTSVTGFTKYAFSEKGGATNGEGGPVICPGAAVYPPNPPDPTQVQVPYQWATKNCHFDRLSGTNIGVAGGDGAVFMLTNVGQPFIVSPTTLTMANVGANVGSAGAPITAFTTGAADAEWYIKLVVVPHTAGSWGQVNPNVVNAFLKYTDVQGNSQQINAQLAENDQVGRMDAAHAAIKGGTTVGVWLASASWNASTKVDVQVEVYNPVSKIYVDKPTGETNFFLCDLGNSQAAVGGTSLAGAGPTGLIGGYRGVKISHPYGRCIDGNSAHHPVGVLIEDQTTHEDIEIVNPSFVGYETGLRLTGRSVLVSNAVIKFSSLAGIKAEPTKSTLYPHHDSRHIKVVGGDLSTNNQNLSESDGSVDIAAQPHAAISHVEIADVDIYNTVGESNLYLDYSQTVYPSTNWSVHGGNWVSDPTDKAVVIAAATLGTALTGALSGVNMPLGVNGVYIWGVSGIEATLGGGLFNTPFEQAGAGAISPLGTLAPITGNWTSTVAKTVCFCKTKMAMVGGTVSNFTIKDSAGNILFTAAAAATYPDIVLNVGDNVSLTYSGFPTTLTFSYVA